VTDSIIGVAAEVQGNGTGFGLASIVVGDDSRVRFD